MPSNIIDFPDETLAKMWNNFNWKEAEKILELKKTFIICN